MATHEPRERPYILQWRSAVLNSQQSSTVKLCLLTLAEWANGDGSNCRPSIPSIAVKASVNEKTVRRSMDLAEAAGFVRRSTFGTDKGWRRFVYQLTIPEGADTVPARSKAGVDTTPTPSCTSSGHSVPVVRTLCPDGAGTPPTDLAVTHPLPRKEHIPVPASSSDRVVPGSRFSEFYGAYPRKVSRAAAENAWKRGKLDGACDAIIADVLASNAPGGRWHGIEQRFIPHAATYLNGRRWEDEWTGAVSGTGRLARDARTDDELAAANEAALVRLGATA